MIPSLIALRSGFGMLCYVNTNEICIPQDNTCAIDGCFHWYWGSEICSLQKLPSDIFVEPSLRWAVISAGAHWWGSSLRRYAFHGLLLVASKLVKESVVE